MQIESDEPKRFYSPQNPGTNIMQVFHTSEGKISSEPVKIWTLDLGYITWSSGGGTSGFIYNLHSVCKSHLVK